MPEYSVNQLKQIVAPIAQKYGVSRIYLFGSRARGDHSVSSDFDLRVDKGRLKGAFALGGLYRELADALGTDVDLLTTGSLDETFLEDIKGDEVLLYDQQGL